MLTDDQRSEYADKLRFADTFCGCPRCGSADISASDYDGDRVLECKVECAACGLSWVEFYRFELATNFEEG